MCNVNIISRDETDPIVLYGVSNFVADHEVCKMAKLKVAALGKTACKRILGILVSDGPCMSLLH